MKAFKNSNMFGSNHGSGGGSGGSGFHGPAAAQMPTFKALKEIKMAVKDQEKTAFITPFGAFCYVSIPFGLKSA